MLNEGGISYGGLYTRYSRRRGRLLRSKNPFTGYDVDYSTALKGENWLLRVMSPSAISCEIEPTHLTYMDRGNQVRAYCDTLTMYSNNLGIADLVVDQLNEQTEDSFEALRKACAIYNFTPQLRTKEVIRGNSVFLQNLEEMRQHLVLYPLLALYKKAGPELIRLWPRGVKHSRDNLRYFFHRSAPPTEIDSVLFVLHCSGHLSINIEEVPYGPESTITCNA